MSLTTSDVTLLEKAANASNFSIIGPRVERWIVCRSSHTTLQLWLTRVSASGECIAAFSRRDVHEALQDMGPPASIALPTGAAGARSAATMEGFYALLRRAYQLSRSLPDDPLYRFRHETASMPRATDVERLAVQRVGQDIFRSGLLDYWDGRCAVTGLAQPELLIASHMKPWADCATDEERLDVFNGLLLAPHVDALFDKGFITFADDGRIVPHTMLTATSRAILQLDGLPPLARIAPEHRPYLQWHREHIWGRPARSTDAV